MSTFFPEGMRAVPGDDERRSYIKWNQWLYDNYGDRGPTSFPEGSRPLPTDDEERSTAKINAILNSL